jgi:radical SAM superfamily enzyme YgiQ (UPF0313 family)
MNYFNKLFLIRARSIGKLQYSLPYGLIYIKSYLRKAGIESFIFDRELSNSLKKLHEALLKFDPDIIGISAITLQIQDTKLLIKKIREWVGNKIIIVGGIHFTALPQDGLDFGADYVVRGEGEVALLNFLTKGPPEKDKIIKGDAIKNLDDIPMIKMTDIRPFIEGNRNFAGQDLLIFTARGCPYNCNFCLSRDQRPKGIRFHSIDYVVEFISIIIKEFGITSFFIADDIFVIKPSRVREFCSKIKKKIHTPLIFHCLTHAGHGNLELYQIMREAGVRRISLGVEHGNDRILSLIGKNTTKAQIEKTCKEIYKAGIGLNLLYILGNIEETNKTITETVNFAIYLHKKYKATSWFSYLQPLPGSPVFKVAENYGRYIKKKRNYDNKDLCYIPFNVDVKHIIKEEKRGSLMGNYNGSLKHYKTIKIVAFILSFLKRIIKPKLYTFIYNHFKQVIKNPKSFKI